MEIQSVNNSKILTLPTKPTPRTRWYGFRVSEAEYRAICDLAQRVGVSSSLLGRDLLLQAVSRVEADLPDTPASPDNPKGGAA